MISMIYTQQLKKESVQFTPFDRLGYRGNMRNDSAEILLLPFLQEAVVSSSGMGRDVHSLMLSIQNLLCCGPLPITASPTLPGALKNGFGETVVACNMLEPSNYNNDNNNNDTRMIIVPLVFMLM